MSDDERSGAGTPILRHARAAQAQGVARTDSTTADAVVAHLSAYYGPVANVFHEIVSDRVHIDVHVIPPNDASHAWTLFTTGMSDRPMTPPPGSEVSRYAELVIRLPASWNVDEQSFQNERWYWPVRWLKQLARLPHDFETWLSSGHTVPNRDPPVPFDAHTRACCMLVMPPMSLPADAWVIEPVRHKRVVLLGVYPIDRDEMQLKLDRGLDAVLDAFEKAGVTDVFDPDRPSAVKRRKLFGLF